MQHELSYHDYVRIAAEAIVSPATVKRIYAGARGTSMTRERIRRAASALNLPPPEAPTKGAAA